MVAFSLNECYFANKGAALVLGGSERGCASQRRSPARAPPQPDIQHHLQSMFCLLRPEETLKMAVKLESAHPGRTRYLVVVCRGKEAALLGIDCNERTTVGLVLRVLADTSIKLDGDGGFSVCVCNRQHIFKPVSVQAMWSALQTLHRASAQAREMNHFAGGTSHAWCAHYESHVDSDRSCLNEWHAMDSIESRRPPSPDSLRLKPRERDETERVIRCTLKEIMMSVDLDEVTSKAIRGRLEEELDMDLAEYKSFIDHEMLTILGQMDAPTEIFDHVYLGSEWNASNLDELQRNGVRHILNVTREIDNFFPGEFDYLNIRVYDDEKTDLLKHWDNTYKYINKARNEGSKVLVHCKMGISRSASVVIAYAMKAFNWKFERAFKHVKAKRSCIKPNNNFLGQLETYQGILDAMKNKEKLQRSKSETNLKSPKGGGKAGGKAAEPTPLVLALIAARARRPRSWSPGARAAPGLQPPHTSVSLEHLPPEHRHMLMPCANGSYSVSPNQIIRLKEDMPPSVRHIVSEIESAASLDRRDFSRRFQRLLFGAPDPVARPPHASPARSSSFKAARSGGDADKIHTWDPGEGGRAGGDRTLSESDNIVKSDSGIVDGRVRAAASEASVDSAGRSDPEGGEGAPSRQSSWSSSDSAVTPDLSRHSWAAGDEREAAAPQPGAELAVIREHAEARACRRADNERKFKESCAIPRQASAPRAATWAGRQCVSAPADTWLRGGLRRRRAAYSHGDLPRAAPPPAAGLVSNLKKEFEARSEPDALRRGEARARSAAADEQAVRVLDLVGRYDRPGRARTESSGAASATLRPRDAPCKRSRLAERTAAHPLCSGHPGHAAPRPPPAPTVLSLAPLDVVSTVMSEAQTKKQLQHGKTHPLTRLNLNRSNNRCSNPVYNTM